MAPPASRCCGSASPRYPARPGPADGHGQDQQAAETLQFVHAPARLRNRVADRGYAVVLGANEKVRERIAKEQELKSQEASLAALAAAVEQPRNKLARIKSSYESQLPNERVELQGE